MNLVVIGPPGSGKSTQAQLLAQKLGLAYVQTGEIFRQISRENSPRGQKIKAILDEGKLVSDQETLEILETFLSAKELEKGFVLDGAPRTLPQAKDLKIKLDRVFYLEVGKKEITKRLMARARADDTTKVIEERIRVYHRRTEPVLDFYRKKGILEEVDGERSVEAIHQDILARLDLPAGRQGEKK